MCLLVSYKDLTAAVAHWVRKKVGCSSPSRDRPKSLKQLVTYPLRNARD